MTPAVFLDRDGTMIDDVGYLGQVADVRWIPNAIAAVARFNAAGYLVCVTTNQAGIGRGLFTAETVAAIHAHLDAALHAAGARVDGWFFCPHHPEAALDAFRQVCVCRKPAPGLIHQACDRFPIDLARSVVIGDKPLDMGLATQAGVRGVLVRTGYGAEAERRHAGQVPGADWIADDLWAAADWVLAQPAGVPAPHAARSAR